MAVRHEESLRRVRMSWEEYLELPHPPKAEWVDGEVVIDLAPVAFSHGEAVGRLLLLLGPLFSDHVLVTEVGLRLPRNRLRAPDLMMVADRPDGEWELLARVDDDHPTAEVELAGVPVPVDLREILRG